jgi:hypothetical protein
MKTPLHKISRLAVLVASLGVILVAPAVASADQLTPAASKPHAVQFNTIVSWHSGKCVDVAGGSQKSGAQVQQFTCNDTVAQLWAKLPTDSGYFRLQVAASGQCMAVKDASQAAGALVVQSPCNFDFNQQWTEGNSDVSGFPQLVARRSGKVLVMRSEALADRTPLIQATYDGPGSDSLHSTAWQFR